MNLTGIYICPVRGVAGMEPPDPDRLSAAAGVMKQVGLDRCILPVVEESLMAGGRRLVRYLDGVVEALDRLAEAGLTAMIMAPAQRLLGVNWTPPYLLRSDPDPGAEPVFCAGRVRRLGPYPWWSEPVLVRKRVRLFQEIAACVRGHPGVAGWVVMDGMMDWARPDLAVADLLSNTFCSEIRESDEAWEPCLSLSWQELLDPEFTTGPALRADRILLRGLERGSRPWGHLQNPVVELVGAAYLGLMARWLWHRPVTVETGWSKPGIGPDEDGLLEVGRRLAGHDTRLAWATLLDPCRSIHDHPPWGVRPEWRDVGLFDEGGQPKALTAVLMEAFSSEPSAGDAYHFIDIDVDKYVQNPAMHLNRLWEHFRGYHIREIAGVRQDD